MSKLVPLLKPRSLPPNKPAHVAVRSMPACLASPSDYTPQRHRPQRRQLHGDTGRRAVGGGGWQQRRVEDIFIHALVTAASCRRHRPDTLHHSKRPGDRAKSGVAHHTQSSRRHFSSKPTKKESAVALAEDPPEITRQDYSGLVDIYDDPELESLEAIKSKAQKRHSPLAPRLVLTPEQEQKLLPRQVLPPENEEHARRLRDFADLCRPEFGYSSLGHLWSSYQSLQKPRPRYLSDKRLAQLFRHLSWAEHKDSGVEENYLALLEECVGEKVPLSSRIWTTAVLFAGKTSRYTTSLEMKNAIEMWQRMEHAGHEADIATFTILFRLAFEAERFALAEAIHEEVMQRGMEVDRAFRINVIHYAGARRDAEKVREAFRALVNAGEIVDTGVMNAVILGLYRAGEYGAAEHVFYRMKALHEQKFGTEAPRQWQLKKKLFQLLNATGRQLRAEKKQHESSFFGAAFSDHDKREQIQKATPIGPDARTYGLLIKHHAHTSGELERIKTCLREMREQQLQIHGSMYVHILRGFQTHGGYYYSNWDPESLEAIWKEIMGAMAGTTGSLEASEAYQSVPDFPFEPSEPEEPEDYDLLSAMMSSQRQPKPVPEDRPLAITPENPGYSPISVSTPEEDQPEPDDSPSPEQPEPSYSPFSFSNDNPTAHEDQSSQQSEPEPPPSDFPEFKSQVYITKALAVSALQAFHKCVGRKRMLQVWGEIQGVWGEGQGEEREGVQRVVDKMVGR